ncbi:response regulator [Herbaspirillum rubrisubalbicans]|uniref:DNA-binding response regulator n=1 Tax=Herbaspirillum rubrisubalbicans TaxID=80842 RepID=A0AAD0U611_9BURK|nr:response regulator transcription factor [Herbaspirillum rubrisubalbicans]AYR23328.1 DNA-binding response regulator [Herbaspirillum rubrisubalbicans]
MPISRLLIIDDHALFRCGLRLVLQAALPQATISEAGSLEDAMRAEDAQAPDMVLLDIQLGGLNGIDGMAVLARKWPDVPIIILSADDTDGTVRAATQRGAAAFVSKAATAEHILQVLLEVAGGRHTLPTPSGQVEASGKPQFTPRQYEVLGLLSQGLTNKAIGRRLNLSENTIRGHVQAILAALEVDNRAEAAFAARRRGLVS